MPAVFFSRTVGMKKTCEESVDPNLRGVPSSRVRSIRRSAMPKSSKGEQAAASQIAGAVRGGKLFLRKRSIYHDRIARNYLAAELEEEERVDRRTRKSDKEELVAGYFSKKKVQKVVDKSSVVVTAQGIYSGFIQILKTALGIVKSAKKSVSGFTKFSPAPLNALDAGLSAYAIYDGAVDANKSRKIGDIEGVRDNALNITGSAANLSAIGTSVGSNVNAYQGHVAKAAGLSTVSSGLGIVIFAIYSVVQAINIARIYRALKRIGNIFSSRNETTEQKYLKAMDNLVDQVHVTDKEDLDLRNKYLAKGKYSEEKIKLEEKKFKKLERRVGPKMAVFVLKFAKKVRNDLKNGTPEEKLKAIQKSRQMILTYKSACYKNLVVRCLNLTGGIIGMIAMGVGIINPLAGGLLFALSSIIMIAAWYYDTNYNPVHFHDYAEKNLPKVEAYVKYMQSLPRKVEEEQGGLVHHKSEAQSIARPTQSVALDHSVRKVDRSPRMDFLPHYATHVSSRKSSSRVKDQEADLKMLAKIAERKRVAKTARQKSQVRIGGHERRFMQTQFV